MRTPDTPAATPPRPTPARPSLFETLGLGATPDTPAEQFAAWLPYSAYLATEKLFVNRDSLGFMLEVMPQSGADERMAEVLISLYSNCPTATGIQFHLFASPHIRDQLRQYANLRVEDDDQSEKAKRWGRPAPLRPGLPWPLLVGSLRQRRPGRRADAVQLLRGAAAAVRGLGRLDLSIELEPRREHLRRQGLRRGAWAAALERREQQLLLLRRLLRQRRP